MPPAWLQRGRDWPVGGRLSVSSQCQLVCGAPQPVGMGTGSRPWRPEQVDGEKQAFSEVHNSSSNPCLPGFSEPHSKPSAPLAAAWAWSPCWLLWGLGHSWPWKLVW